MNGNNMAKYDSYAHNNVNKMKNSNDLSPVEPAIKKVRSVRIEAQMVEKSLFCTICHNVIEPEMKATIESCDHLFCFPCISDWAVK